MLDPTTQQLLQVWLDANDQTQILTFVETLIDQRNRAEYQTRSYQHQIAILTERTNAIIKPMLEKSQATKPEAKPIKKPTPTTEKPTLNLDIKL